MKLWGGRFVGGLDPLAAKLNASISFDRRFWDVDVRGSVAWARALARAEVISAGEAAEELCAGLQQVWSEFNAGVFRLDPGDEDIHTAVERRLGEIVGAVGGKLHTGRSRNDQVATDFRLWVMQAAGRMREQIGGLQGALLAQAQTYFGVLMPGYTHLQRAQPILFSHWLLSHFWALERDRARFAQVQERTSDLPLGSAALAGTAFPIDRTWLAQALGFKRVSPNSVDAVADRDFAAEFVFAAALLGVHLSRLAEALILFTTAEFGFLEMDDSYSTGSSLMPQKKNPDMLEIARGKAGALLGALTGLLATLKGLPSAYDKDMQDDKLYVFQAFDTLDVLLPVLAGTVATATARMERMQAGLDAGMLATDLAEHLVRQGVPFRQAHGLTGKSVRRAQELGVPLDKLPAEEWQAIAPDVGPYPAEVFNFGRAVEQRAAVGGTAPEAVRRQLTEAVMLLKSRQNAQTQGA